jgi:nucleoside-diphosphate-sugar epimerase
VVRERCEQGGWSVVSLSRPTARATVGETRPFTLGQAVDPAILGDVDVLIHCAWDLTLTDPKAVREVNVAGTSRLVDAAISAAVDRVVFVSSMSAYEGTAQVYGRAKLECERSVAAAGGVSVRPGLVYGEGWGGMAGSLRRLVSLPVVPLVAGDSYQFTVHESDVADGLFALAMSSPVPSPIGLAHPDPVPFRRLLEGIARQANVRPRFLPVPWRAVLAAMRAAELAHVPLPLRSDSLLGVVRPAPAVPNVEAWAGLGVSLRAFDL